MPKTPFKQKVILIVFGLFLCAVLLEIGLRVGGFITLSLHEHRNRISIKQKGAYRIMCIGESTTDMGGINAYPKQLENILNQRNIGIKFSVINEGTCGETTMDILTKLEDNLKKFNPDMVIAMMGINDHSDFVKYNDVHKNTLFFKNFKIVKFMKLLYLNIVAKLNSEYNLKMTRDDAGSFVKKNTNKIYDTTLKDSSIRAQGEESTDSVEYIKLARTYVYQGDSEKAIEMFKKAIGKDPKNADLYIELGFYGYAPAGKHELVEQVFREAVKLAPDSAEGYSSLGWYFRELSQDENKHVLSEAMFKKAIEKDPQNMGAFTALGYCYISQQKYVLAEQMFLKTLEIDPEYSDAHAGLGQLYQYLGKGTAAAAHFQKVKETSLKFYNSLTRNNYQQLKNILVKKKIRLVCVQYPLCPVEKLKNYFDTSEAKNIIFVDNENLFKEALKRNKYAELFIDRFAAIFGHCTPKGNRLLAENIANVILEDIFHTK